VSLPAHTGTSFLRIPTSHRTNSVSYHKELIMFVPLVLAPFLGMPCLCISNLGSTVVPLLHSPEHCAHAVISLATEVSQVPEQVLSEHREGLNLSLSLFFVAHFYIWLLTKKPVLLDDLVASVAEFLYLDSFTNSQ
jgi:hypothetical protein